MQDAEYTVFSCGNSVKQNQQQAITRRFTMQLSIKKAVSLSAMFLLTAIICFPASAQLGNPSTGWYTATIAANPGSGPKVFNISNADQLAGLAQIVNGTAEGINMYLFVGDTVVLTGPIDLSAYGVGRGWVPIGDRNNNDIARFGGTFDGGGHVIRNLTILRPDDDNQGLFGALIGGTVINVRLEDVEVVGRNFVGGVAGRVNHATSAGGSRSSIITDVYTSGRIVGIQGVGGVVGIIGYSSLSSSSSSAEVSGDSLIGGLIGSKGFAVSRDNHFTGKVGGGYSVGGVVGGCGAPCSIIGSYSTGTVVGGSDVGGVVGVLIQGDVSNSFSTGSVIGEYNNVGGVAGLVSGGSVDNSYSTGVVSSNYFYVGGVVGLLRGVNEPRHVGVITNSYATGPISGNGHIGGILGGADGLTRITNNAALNSEVRGSTNVGRVVGRIIMLDTLTNNHAFDEMPGSTDTAGWANIGAAARDGANITAAQIRMDGTIRGLFINDSLWTVEDGKLPGLFGETVAMPEHLSPTVSINFVSRHSAPASAQFVASSGRTLNLRFTDRGRVDIFALNGARVRSLDLDRGVHTLRMNSLPSGLYVVRASSGAWSQSVRMMAR
jgi:hypothetical protein